VRILIVDHYYPEVVRAIYAARPHLGSRSYFAQRQAIDSYLFGETAFEVNALRNLGHEAYDSLINIRPLQVKWANEHGLTLSTGSWTVRSRRGFIRVPSRQADRWIAEALLAQVRFYRPDVLHIQCMDMLDPRHVLELRGLVRLVVGQIAARLPLERALMGYDLVVSSLPNFVERFRTAGLDSELLPLAFEPSVADRIGQLPRDISVSFAGSLSKDHRGRVEFLEAVATRTRVSLWTAGADDIAPHSPLRLDLHGPAWGSEMYGILAASKVTLNHHIDLAEGFANNLRLYEATGMGALLLTDAGSNLGDLFDVGGEVLTYGSAEECADKAEYYLAHPAEASSIAAAGQARTLRDHTWLNRMGRLVNMIEKRL
jgi:spore maturation protein CgeB